MCVSAGDALAEKESTDYDRFTTEAEFLVGLAALERGEPEVAIPIFQRILSRQPGLIRVRLELARAYFFAERWQRARQEFFNVLSADIPDPVRQNVLRFIRAIDARRGFEWDLSIALAELGDGRNFQSDTIDLNIGGLVLPFTLERSDNTELGFEIDGAARLRTRLGSLGNTALTASGEVFWDVDAARDKDLRDATYGLRGSLRFSAPRATYSFGVIGDRRDLQDRKWEERIGIETAAERRSEGGLSVFASATALSVENLQLDDLDGTLVAWQVGVARAFGGFGSIGAAFFGEHRGVSAGFEGYDTFGARAFGRVDTKFGFEISPSLFWERRHYRETNPIFTADPDQTRWGAVLRVLKSDIFIARGFSPFVEIGYEKVTSDITAFSYDETAIQIGLDRQF